MSFTLFLNKVLGKLEAAIIFPDNQSMNQQILISLQPRMT